MLRVVRHAHLEVLVSVMEPDLLGLLHTELVQALGLYDLPLQLLVNDPLSGRPLDLILGKVSILNPLLDVTHLIRQLLIYPAHR